MQQCQDDYLIHGDYDKDTFQLDDFPFVFHTVDRCRDILDMAGVHIFHAVASDGVSEFKLADTITDATTPADELEKIVQQAVSVTLETIGAEEDTGFEVSIIITDDEGIKEISKDDKLLIVCNRGRKAYLLQNILKLILQIQP